MDNNDGGFMLDDCEHVDLKCRKCMREMPEGMAAQFKMPDTVKVTGVDVLISDVNQPTHYKPARARLREHDEGFDLHKGPLMVEVKFTEEGVIIDIWDTTENGGESIASCYEFYASCEDPWNPDFITNPAQPKLILTGDLDWERGPCGPAKDEEKR